MARAHATPATPSALTSHLHEPPRISQRFFVAVNNQKSAAGLGRLQPFEWRDGGGEHGVEKPQLRENQDDRKADAGQRRRKSLRVVRQVRPGQGCLADSEDHRKRSAGFAARTLRIENSADPQEMISPSTKGHPITCTSHSDNGIRVNLSTSQ